MAFYIVNEYKDLANPLATKYNLIDDMINK